MTIFGIRIGGSSNGSLIHAGYRSPRNLAELPRGQKAMVTGFSPRINPDRKAHLQAYGVVPGRVVRVSQHLPVTVLQVDQTELALEREIAREIEIDVSGD